MSINKQHQNTSNNPIPKIWGAGQIFAFSALDGKASNIDDFAGMLSGDRLGIRFYSKVIRELAIVGIQSDSLYFNAVTGDYINAVTTENEENIIIYYDTHTIIGQFSTGACPGVHIDGKATITCENEIEYHDTSDNELSALMIRGNKFAFAFGHSKDEVKSRILKGIDADINADIDKKLQYFKDFGRPDITKYNELFTKCISVMKTQLYSPEGHFKTIWSTPDRLPHKDLWLWDSVFHAIGFRHLDAELAQQLILDIFTMQHENGMISHQARPGWVSSISQPPVIAWGSWKVFELTGNIDFIKTVFEHNKRFLNWVYENRKSKNEELFIWDTNDVSYNRCDESGIDNSPRFDAYVCLEAIDFACYMANEMRYMKKIADVLGEDSSIFTQRFESIREAVNRKLWDEEDGFYYDYDLTNNKLHKVECFTSFLPLFAGLCDKTQAQSLISWLKNPNTFNTYLPIPTISKREKSFRKDMWCSPVWVNCNYLIYDGLKNYGYNYLADELSEKLLSVIDEWYHKTGCIFEFFDCDNEVPPYKLGRKGPVVEPYNIRIKYQAIRDFGWSSTLTCDMISSKYGK